MSWDFDHVGLIEAEPSAAGADPELAAKLGYRPTNPLTVSGLSAEQMEEVETFLAALDANEDVQNVFAGLQQ